MRLRPGQSTLAFYTAHNTSAHSITGVSTYNVAPQQVGQYFNKIQCFCFEVSLGVVGRVSVLGGGVRVCMHVLAGAGTSGAGEGRVPAPALAHPVALPLDMPAHLNCACARGRRRPPLQEQRLRPGEKIDMPVFFYLDPEFAVDPKMRGINQITLSYTFFKVAEEEEEQEGQQQQVPAVAGLPAAAAAG